MSTSAVVPDSNSKTCQVCNTKFGVLKKKHTCSQCGLSVCKTCSPDKIQPADPNADPIRVCKDCKAAYDAKGTVRSNDDHPTLRQGTLNTSTNGVTPSNRNVTVDPSSDKGASVVQQVQPQVKSPSTSTSTSATATKPSAPSKPSVTATKTQDKQATTSATTKPTVTPSTPKSQKTETSGGSALGILVPVVVVGLAVGYIVYSNKQRY